MDYVELHCHSDFSFLLGASHPQQLVARAAELGYSALALTDRDGLYGAVRFHEAAQIHGIRPIYGSELSFDDGTRLTVLARDDAGWANLSALITAGRRAREKGASAVPAALLEERAQGLIALSGGPQGAVPAALLRGDLEGAEAAADELRQRFEPGCFFLEVMDHQLPFEARILDGMRRLAQRLALPLVATHGVLYHLPQRRRLQDVMTCVRHHTDVRQAGTLLMPNSDYALLPPAEALRRWRHLPSAVASTRIIADMCQVDLGALDLALPAFPVPPPFPDAQGYLAHLSFLGAAERFDQLEAPQLAQLERELAVIAELGLAGYFLIVWDIMRFCRERGILAQGRGSAANSAVCFALGITNVDPIKLGLLFERFLSEGRSEPPDIDIDIANSRREEVIQYVYERYGRDHAGMVCEVITYRARSALRDVAKAMGLSPTQVDALAKRMEGRSFGRGVVIEGYGEVGGADDRPLSPQELRGDGAPPPPVPERLAQPTPTSPLEGEVPGAARGRGGRGDTTAKEGGDPDLTPPPPVPERLAQPTPTSPLEGEVPGAARGRGGRGDTADDTPLPPEAPGTGARGAPAAEQGDDPHAPPSVDGVDQGLISLILELAQELEGCPRHLGIHVGGMILSAAPLSERVPIENASMEGRTVIQWDKDDVGALKAPKIDLLGLGMLSLLTDCLGLIRDELGIVIDPARLPWDDDATYDMICEADTVGVFQIESRAQMSTLPRMRPRTFYDLVVEVALIRPGPLQGDMVHPYLRRRAGEEAIDYPHPDLIPVLERTLGIPLFQEQGMKVAITAAGFSPAEADALRRAMKSRRATEEMARLRRRLIDGMLARGYDPGITERVVAQIEAFSSYGFPESHAASFASLVYLSAWLKRHYPGPFYCALLNNQPMGFYSPSTIVADARRHKVVTAPVDVVASDYRFTLHGRRRLLSGLKAVRGLGERHWEVLKAARDARPFTSVADLCARGGLPRILLERLAQAGGLRRLERDRRRALWQVQGHRERPGLAAPSPAEAPVPLDRLSPTETLVQDLSTVGFSPDDHPLRHLRPTLDRWGVVPSERLERLAPGRIIRVAGLASVRQRPPTAGGFCFLTLEDPWGMISVVVPPDIYDRYRPVVRRSMLIVVEGRLERSRGVVSIRAQKVGSMDDRFQAALRSRDFH